MADTSIQWTDKTWNPTVGCTRCSPGCKECYAFELHDRRHEAYKQGKRLPLQYAKPFAELQLMENRLGEPLKWRKPCRVFVNSMSDLFHEDVPDDFIDRIFAVMAIASRHTFQILTKRAQRMRDYILGADGREIRIDLPGPPMNREPFDWPLPNVHLGVSVEDQRWADERIPMLLQTPAAIRFLSCEPLLGPLDLRPWLPSPASNGTLAGYWHEKDPATPRVRWVIVGCESGSNRRPMDPAWDESLQLQCQEAGVAFFRKQIEVNGRVSGDPAEWAETLRARQFPETNR